MLHVTNSCLNIVKNVESTFKVFMDKEHVGVKVQTYYPLTPT